MTKDESGSAALLKAGLLSVSNGLRTVPLEDVVKALNYIEALEAENESLKGLVQGWHYLAVGPDEMGDYYTQKQLVKLSAKYASPAIAAMGGGGGN